MGDPKFGVSLSLSLSLSLPRSLAFALTPCLPVSLPTLSLVDLSESWYQALTYRSASLANASIFALQLSDAQNLALSSKETTINANKRIGWPQRSPTFGAPKQSHHGKFRKRGSHGPDHFCDLCADMCRAMKVQIMSCPSKKSC